MIGRPYPGDTYDPGHFWRQPKTHTHRYSQSPWQRKLTGPQQLQGNNYVIPLWTYVPGPNPYIESRRHTAEEYGRNSFDIDWRVLR